MYFVIFPPLLVSSISDVIMETFGKWNCFEKPFQAVLSLMKHICFCRFPHRENGLFAAYPERVRKTKSAL